jgi:hypothetical protein
MSRLRRLFFFFGLLILLSACTVDTEQSSVAVTGAEKADKIEVVHFHGTVQCWSCETVGEYTQYTLDRNFAKELADGTISYRSINVELPENAAVVNQYQARGSSLFVNAIYDGEDHISEDVTVWRMIGSQSQFETYLRDKINQLLGK